MTQPAARLRLYRNVAVALFLLLAATLLAAQVQLGSFGLVVAMAIAGAKAMLVASCFMHLRHSSPLSRLFAVSGLLWLAILLGLTVGDYLCR